MNKRLFAMVAAIFANQAFASNDLNSIEGEWGGRYHSMNIMNMDDGYAATKISVGTERCMGVISGIGQLNNNVLQFRPMVRNNENEKCVMTIVFDRNGKSATISEGDQCSYFHGAGCGFDGVVVRKKK